MMKISAKEQNVLLIQSLYFMNKFVDQKRQLIIIGRGQISEDRKLIYVTPHCHVIAACVLCLVV